MWVLLRLAAVLIVGIVKYRFRRTRGMQCQSHGMTWFIKQRTSRRRPSADKTWFGLPFRHPVFFRLSRETWSDRLFKAIGLSREIQTGNEEFDRSIYIACDHPALASVLTTDPSLPAALLKLFDANTTSIFSDGEILWVKRKTSNTPGEETLRQLRTVRDGLQRVAPSRMRLLQDPFFRRALLVESIAWSTMAYAVPSFFETLATPHPLYFEQDRLAQYAGMAAVALFVVLFALFWLLLQGSSRAHRVLMESGLILAIGLPFTAREIVSDINIQRDRSPLIVVTAPIESTFTRIEHAKRSSQTHFHIMVGQPDRPLRIWHDLDVNASMYRTAHRGGTVTFAMRAGALGIPWVQDMRVSD